MSLNLKQLSSPSRVKLFGFLMLFCCTSLAHAKDIFDEDWTLSKPTKQFTKELPSTKPSTTQADRQAIPDSAARFNSRKTLKIRFKTEAFDSTPVGRRRLAELLLQHSEEVESGSPDQFATLFAAIVAGKQASCLTVVCQAIDKLDIIFAIDALQLKADCAIGMSLKGTSPAGAARNCQVGLKILDRLIIAGDLAIAERLLAALRAAAPSANSIVAVTVRDQQLQQAQASAQQFARAEKKLKASPDDATAKIAVGEFLCFVKRDWVEGLKKLAKEKNQDLAGAVAEDVAGADGPASQIHLGDTWWSLAEKSDVLIKLAAHQRSAYWYKRALQSSPIADKSTQTAEQRVRAADLESDPSTGLYFGLPIDSVIWFRESASEANAFVSLAKHLRIVKPEQQREALAEPNLYANAGVVIWGINRLRSATIETLNQKMQDALKQYVYDGGDLIIFEQFNEENMWAIDKPFGIETINGAAGAEILSPELMERIDVSNLPPDWSKSISFYNSYDGLPQGTQVLVQDGKAHAAVAVMPFGDGRLILLGTNLDGGSHKLVDETLDVIYHWKSATASLIGGSK